MSDDFGIMGLLLSCGAILLCSLGIQYKQTKHEELYETGQTSIVATVIEETYENKLKSVPKKHIEGIMSEAYSNETVKLDSSYTLKLKTDDGKTLGVSILDGPRTKKEALDVLVSKGTRIRFPKGNLEKYEFDPIPEETYFNNQTQFGNKRADRISVLE